MYIVIVQHFRHTIYWLCYTSRLRPIVKYFRVKSKRGFDSENSTSSLHINKLQVIAEVK